MHIHKWTKWEWVTATMRNPITREEAEVETMERHCLKCNRHQFDRML